MSEPSAVRAFELPTRANNEIYTITLQNYRELVVHAGDDEQLLFLTVNVTCNTTGVPADHGTLHAGINTISKEQGTLYIS